MGIEKLPAITEKQWLEVCEFNRKMAKEFLNSSKQLSPKTLITYRSNLMIFFNWVKDELGNKPLVDIKKREILKYYNWLVSRDSSSSDIKNKKAAISSLCKYIMMYYDEEYPLFHNIATGFPKVEPNFVHKKEPPTKDEIDMMFKELEERGEWQKLAYLKYTYSTGCRRAESIQLLKSDVFESELVEKVKRIAEGDQIVEKTIRFYKTSEKRTKGKGKNGKRRWFPITEDTMFYLRKWLEIRGEDDCEYVFAIKRNGSYKQISDSTLNYWGSTIFTEILGRRFHPHVLREAIATNSSLEGKDIRSIQSLLGHESADTTNIYIIRDKTEDMEDLLID